MYTELATKDPSYPFSHYNIGFILFEFQGKPSEALPYFIQAAKVKPDYAEAIYMAGLCNEKTGNRELAIQDYREALKRNPRFELAIAALQRLGETI